MKAKTDQKVVGETALQDVLNSPNQQLSFVTTTYFLASSSQFPKAPELAAHAGETLPNRLAAQAFLDLVELVLAHHRVLLQAICT